MGINKELPNSIETERELLGGIFHNPKILVDVIPEMKSEYFYLKKHMVLYNVICSLFAEGSNLDIPLIINKIGKDNINDVGGISYITSISVNGLYIEPKKYIDILKDLYNKRKLITLCDRCMNELYKSESKVDTVAAALMGGATIETNNNTVVDDITLMEMGLNEIEKRYKNKGELPGMKTGIRGIDNNINGFKKGELITIAGRPAMGKTAITLNIVDGLIKNNNKVFLSEMEMTEEGLALRRYASKTRISNTSLQTGNISEKDFDKIARAYSSVAAKNGLHTDCSSSQTIMSIKAKAKAIKQSHGLDCIVIDHIGLLDVIGDNRNLIISEITRQCKIMAKELDVAVIILSQLSRACEQRADHRPMLSDLKESGSIEADSDLVMFVYRDEYYNKESENKNVMELIIAKQRNGKTGTINLLYDSDTQFIGDLDL